MTDDLEPVWKALADPTRRRVLDLLREGPRILRELSEEFETEMTRYGVMKHLRVLREAGLVSVRKVGRRSYHFLNPVPIRQIHDRWINRYTEPWAEAMVTLKTQLEDPLNAPRYLFETYIRTTPEALWAAITEPENTRRYFFSSEVESDWAVGSAITYRLPDGSVAANGEIVEIDPPTKLVTSWRALWDEEMAAESPSRVTWEIEPLEGICRLTVLHDDFAEGSKTFESISSGWPMILSSLKSLLETGEPLAVAQ